MNQSHPIIFLEDFDLRGMVVAELTAQGTGEPKFIADVDSCIEALVLDQNSLLVLDMSLGSEKINKILSASKAHFNVETRAILLFVSELSEGALATASEYNVSQIHAGEPQQETISVCIRHLVHEIKTSAHLRDVLVKVATARSRGDWAIVTPLLQSELDKNPSDERLALELAENYIHERNWDGANQLLEPYLSTTPPMIRALNLKARCLMHAGNFEGAAAVMQKAKLLNPHNIDRLIEFGHILISADRVGEAREQFEEATDLDATNEDAVRGVGQCMLMQGEVNEALDFLKSLSGPRELASVFNSAAVMSIHNGNFAKGMALYKKAFGVIGADEKTAARLMFNMGLGYKKNEQLNKAIDCFDKSIQLDPEYDKAHQQKQAAEKSLSELRPHLVKPGQSPVPADSPSVRPANPQAEIFSDDVDLDEESFTPKPASGE